jgi:3-deoxy-manno-octulosonate cytidylyltransferase (CMP-KDO synthetase)
MSVAIVLPARLASTRLPNKLLLDRSGKTLLEHTIERAQIAQKQYPDLFTTIRVACDDEKLVAAAKRAGADAVMTRKDHQSGTDRIAEAAADLKEDIIVNLQADEPEIEIDSIHKIAVLLSQPEDQAFQRKSENKAVMGTLATFIYDKAIFENPNVVKVVGDNMPNRAIYFSRAPIPHARDGQIVTKSDRGPIYGLHHIGIYSYRREFLFEFIKLMPSRLELTEKLEQMRAIENHYGIRLGLVTNHFPGIDTPEDYEAFLKRLKSKQQDSQARS